MTKVCALCDADFPVRTRDEVPVKVVSVDGKLPPGTVLFLPKTVHEKIQQWSSELKDDAPNAE